MALIALTIAGLGPGRWSLDNAVGLDDLNGYVGLVIAGLLGLGAGIGQVALFYRPQTQGADSF